MVEIALGTLFVPFGLLFNYRVAPVSAYLTVRVNLGLARFLYFLRRRPKNSSTLASECREKLATASPRV